MNGFSGTAVTIPVKVDSGAIRILRVKAMAHALPVEEVFTRLIEAEAWKILGEQKGPGRAELPYSERGIMQAFYLLALEWQHDKGEGVRKTHLTRAEVRSLTRLTPPAFDPALARLVERGWLRRTDGEPQPGRRGPIPAHYYPTAKGIAECYPYLRSGDPIDNATAAGAWETELGLYEPEKIEPSAGPTSAPDGPGSSDRLGLGAEFNPHPPEPRDPD